MLILKKIVIKNTKILKADLISDILNCNLQKNEHVLS